ncbi:Hypothetical predicted protein, partial [Prunus dulcis]
MRKWVEGKKKSGGVGRRNRGWGSGKEIAQGKGGEQIGTKKEGRNRGWGFGEEIAREERGDINMGICGRKKPGLV